MILSASRRTDIPAFFSEWFINRLREGYVLTRNPFNPNQVSRIELSPDLIDCIVFWTKDPEPMMEKLPILDTLGYRYYFQFTLTPYGRDIERNMRDKKDIVSTFRKLSELIGKERIFWRYDPIILNDVITEQYHEEQFERLNKELTNNTSSCTISFVDMYAKLSKAVKSNMIREISKAEMFRLAKAFSKIGERYGIELRACCEETDFSSFGIKSAACIDENLIDQICDHPLHFIKDKNQRVGCGCVKSVDIGAYNTCKNGCIYCYANHSVAFIQKNCTKHNINSDILIGRVDKEEEYE